MSTGRLLTWTLTTAAGVLGKARRIGDKIYTDLYDAAQVGDNITYHDGRYDIIYRVREVGRSWDRVTILTIEHVRTHGPGAPHDTPPNGVREPE